jgi:ubiquitin carboxyl-terminal hydrolase 20/33
MDQLHEELKEHREEDRESLLRLKNVGEVSSDEDETEVDGTGSSQSDAEYETCDSGVSEQSSLSDDGERGTKRRYSKVSQADKLKNKFTNRSLKKSGTDVSYSQQQRPTQTSPVKHRTKKPTKTRSIISDIFDGKLLSSVQCLTCDRISTRIETFQDLSLPIPSKDHIDMLRQGSLAPQKANSCSDVVYVTSQPSRFSRIMQWMSSWFWPPVVSLDDCLSAFFSTDELKGDNMYSCEKCNKLRNGTKFSKVLELPEVLCIHLKRFRHELMFSSKIASYVSFPLDDLDMRVHLHKDCVSKVTTYGLISVICHHGTAGGGHYVCYALNTSTNQWFEFDDQRVTPVKPEDVKNCGAYVLFYKKTSQDMMQLREEIEELMKVSSKESSDLNFFISTQWINRFNTFAEPGPIDNSDFLCQHGGVDPVRAEFIKKISIPVKQSVWEFLFKT